MIIIVGYNGPFWETNDRTQFFVTFSVKIYVTLKNGVFSVLIDTFINLYYNSNIDCNKKNKNKLYDLYNNIVLNKFVHSNKCKNNFIFGNYK